VCRPALGPWGGSPASENGLSPPRSPSARRGLFEGWSPGTPPARQPGDEIRVPDTLVDVISHAPADVGSIPTVSISPTFRPKSEPGGTRHDLWTVPFRAKPEPRARRAGASSLTTTPEYAASTHPVETPIEALGCRTEKERGEHPPGSATDEDGQERRQAGEGPHESGPDEGASERHSGSDRNQPDSRSVPRRKVCRSDSDRPRGLSWASRGSPFLFVAHCTSGNQFRFWRGAGACSDAGRDLLPSALGRRGHLIPVARGGYRGSRITIGIVRLSALRA
jgi:hypothetical protein